MDTLLDSCIVQLTADSGATWTGWYNLNVPEFASHYEGSLYNTQINPNTAHRILFNGRSGGWVHEWICFSTTTIVNKTTAIFNDDFGYRFLFKSDSIDSGKPGWMIDDICMTSPIDFILSVDNIEFNPFQFHQILLRLVSIRCPILLTM